MSDNNILSRGTTVLLSSAAAVVVVAGLHAFASTVGPIVLALVIVVVVSPLDQWLRSKGVPPALASFGPLISAFAIVVAMVGSLAWAAAEMIGLFRSERYTEPLAQTQAAIVERLAVWGINGEDVQEVVDKLDIGSVVGHVSTALSGLLGILSAASLMLLTLLFMAGDAPKFSRLLAKAADERPEIVGGLMNFGKKTRAYFVVSTVFGLIVAIINTAILMIAGIPLALVWGLVSLVTNYVPNIGFLLGLIPPATLALFEGGWQLALWIVVLYLLVNIVVQSLIQPRFVGDAVGLSATLTFLSLIFWSWVLGPLGALLAVPLTLLAMSLMVDIDPTTNWARPLISLNESNAPTPQDANGDEDAPIA